MAVFNYSVFEYQEDGMKSGFRVNHAKAGKKIIGTASPGNSSGFFTVNGSDNDMGIMIAAKDIIESKKWKTIIPFFFQIPVKK